ncbi:MAG TPA: CHAT domain-containing protein, partial [Ferruginibacter sp.]|nr:CHAT domain-containing protein [Ferruginibacter sp.]
LLVLSACETAGGEAQSGEGLMSLSRAFMYAGADAVLSTLWKTEDRVSNYLMQKMYVYMQTGLPPEEALRKAKISLLTSGEIGARYLSPNYWANFVYAGHVDLHKGPGNNHW